MKEKPAFVSVMIMTSALGLAFVDFAGDLVRYLYSAQAESSMFR